LLPFFGYPMLLKLTSNVSIDGVEHKAGTVIDTDKKGVSSECLLTWKWAVETDEEETTPEVFPEAPPEVENKIDSPIEPPAEPVQPNPPTESAPPVEQPVEQPVEPVAPKPSRKSRK
jgi:hypothetical protein